jgi:hypothetical protein
MPRQKQPEVLATVSASAPRRIMGIAVLAVLGGLLIYAALAQPPQVFGWQAVLLLAGGITLYLAERMRRASVVTLELTREALRDSEGRVLARLDQIETVSRGIFAFKPSNGFVVTTRQPLERHWNPGLWWRFGTHIGVGGVTPAVQTKFMADMIQTLLDERRAQKD